MGQTLGFTCPPSPSTLSLHICSPLYLGETWSGVNSWGSCQKVGKLGELGEDWLESAPLSVLSAIWPLEAHLPLSTLPPLVWEGG